MSQLYILIVFYTISGGAGGSLGPMDRETCQKGANALIASAPTKLNAMCQPVPRSAPERK
jgi:hypothetical protein